MLANNRNFKRCAAKYLASKVLSYDNWCDSITQGRKGDVLALYSLCMLFSHHAVVHLHNNVIWSTLASPGINHSSHLQKCDIHLCYLGRGLFMELVEQDIPLQILVDKPDIQSIVIGELSIEEGLLPLTPQIKPISTKAVKTRRDVAQDTACKSRHNTNILDTLTHQTYTKKDSKLISTVKIVIVKMNIKNPNESYQVTQQRLLQLPKSRYRPDNYYKKLLSP